MKIVFHDQAKTDLDKAAAFYEQQEKGLGREVYSFLAKQIEQLPDRAGTHLFLGHCYRAVLQGRFPITLFSLKSKGNNSESSRCLMGGEIPDAINNS